MLKSGRKLPLKNQWLQHFALRSLQLKHYDKKEISWKNIFHMCFIYVYFWNLKMDNPILRINHRVIAICFRFSSLFSSSIFNTKIMKFPGNRTFVVLCSLNTIHATLRCWHRLCAWVVIKTVKESINLLIHLFKMF